MKKTTPRRSFLGKTLMATVGLACVSSTSVLNAFTAKESPFEGYNPYAEAKTDLRVNSFGKHVAISGKIFESSGKIPLSNALVEVWHMSPGSKKFRHRTKLKTNAFGEYRFITDLPNRKMGKHYKVYFKVSNSETSYFTELSFNNHDAFISDKHWENNNQLGDELLFPTYTTFLNRSTIQFNMALTNSLTKDN